MARARLHFRFFFGVLWICTRILVDDFTVRCLAACAVALALAESTAKGRCVHDHGRSAAVDWPDFLQFWFCSSTAACLSMSLPFSRYEELLQKACAACRLGVQPRSMGLVCPVFWHTSGRYMSITAEQNRASMAQGGLAKA